jgi:hypothetical protein
MSLTFSMLNFLGRDILYYIFSAVLNFPFVKWMVAAVKRYRRDFFAPRMPHTYVIQCRRCISKKEYLIRNVESVNGITVATAFYL